MYWVSVSFGQDAPPQSCSRSRFFWSLVYNVGTFTYWHYWHSEPARCSGATSHCLFKELQGPPLRPRLGWKDTGSVFIPRCNDGTAATPTTRWFQHSISRNAIFYLWLICFDDSVQNLWLAVCRYFVSRCCFVIDINNPNFMALDSVLRVLDTLTLYYIQLFRCSFIADRVLLIFAVNSFSTVNILCRNLAEIQDKNFIADIHVHSLLPPGTYPFTVPSGAPCPSISFTLSSVVPSCAQPMFSSSRSNCARCVPGTNFERAFIGLKR